MRVIRDRRALLRGLLLAWFIAVAVITLTPTPAPDANAGAARAIRTGRRVSGFGGTDLQVEFAANIVMFVPFGVLAALLRPHLGWWLLVGTGTSISVAIELAQLFLLPSRVADLRDVVSNTLGTAIGVLLVASASRLASERPPRDVTL